MSIVILYADSSSRLDLQLPWALRIAAARGSELQILVRSDGKLEAASRAIDLEGDGLGAELSALLSRWAGEWRLESEPQAESEDGGAEGESEGSDAAEAVEDERLQVSAKLISATGGVGELIVHVREAEPDLLVATQVSLEAEDADSSARRRHLMQRVSCEVVLIRAGAEPPTSDGLLVPCARGPHCAAALRLARDMTPEGEQFEALVIEPEIGSDARLVGRRILDRILVRALDDDASRAARVIRIQDAPHVGILEQAEERKPGLILMGTSKRGAIGQRLRGTVGQRLVKANTVHHVGFVRAEIPIRGRVQRGVEAWLQTTVPQLEREARIDLFERVQGNSAWDFDFLALIALATLISSAGLIENSAAVIIGAMLVAPLMTPLLGMGLAMVQGNPRLLRLASRTVLLGFLTSLVIGFLSGLLVPRFQVATPEMVARDWPLLLDMVIAFAAGLAGAYTSSRPNLLAALPGVAIAAALVPPIATAGLALSIADFDLAGGAILLFLVNAVAIALATTFALWAVGIRDATEGSSTTRRVAASFIALLSAIGLYLIIFRPTYLAPDELSHDSHQRFAACLSADSRMIDATIQQEADGRVLVIQVGGTSRPTPDVIDALRRAARSEFGDDLAVRVISRWEWESQD
jgi:uncharacterized hydrophobic protein (TIGR00271 family)